jgi:hypothetical protein
MSDVGRILPLADAPRRARIIVCGGRDYDDWETVFRVLDALDPVEVAQGDARGADAFAREWARSRGRPLGRFPAFWDEDGRSAGPLRNRRMFDLFAPDGVVSFLGGRGTADMERVALGGGAWLVRITTERAA